MGNSMASSITTAAVALILLVGCSKPATEAPAGEPAETTTMGALLELKEQAAEQLIEAMTPEMLSARAEQGGKLFSSLCADCHPRSGRGDYLKRIPATLLVRRSEAELVKWIRGVDQHRTMPSFTDLDPQQLEALAAYLAAEVNR